MRILKYILLAVADPAASSRFYSDLLGLTPVQDSPTFVLFVLPNGIKLGFWIASEIEPAPKLVGDVEIAFSEADDTDVRAIYASWQHKASIVQRPTQTDFGFIFVAEDPDSHRLRVFSPAPDRR
ncbi:MAG: VOC family protein [Candidatus Devosia symbiotica]|nr:VOC family protein [Candidatus Devosia symbiotica]